MMDTPPIGETLEMILRVQIGVGRYLAFNARPSGGGGQNLFPLRYSRWILNGEDIDTELASGTFYNINLTSIENLFL